MSKTSPRPFGLRTRGFGSLGLAALLALGVSELAAQERIEDRYGIGGSRQPDDPRQAQSAPPPSPAGSTAERAEVEVGGERFETELSEAEREIINQKRSAIIRHLYEEETLDDARDALEERERSESFEDTLRSQFPLTPEEIRIIRERRLEATRAENEPLQSPEMRMRTVEHDVNDPEPLVVNVSRGYASSLVFFDETGAPWPIKPVEEQGAIGDESAFRSFLVSEDRNVLVWEVTEDFRESNALIDLEGLSSPVVVKLDGRTDSVDARVSVRLPGHGPNARSEPSTSSQFEDVPQSTISLLNGDIPQSAKEYDIVGAPGTAIYYDDWLYVRTRARLMSPPAHSQVSSPTGYRVYQISPTEQLLFSHEGEVREARVEERFSVEIDYQSSIYE